MSQIDINWAVAALFFIWALLGLADSAVAIIFKVRKEKRLKPIPRAHPHAIRAFKFAITVLLPIALILAAYALN